MPKIQSGDSIGDLPQTLDPEPHVKPQTLSPIAFGAWTRVLYVRLDGGALSGLRYGGISGSAWFIIACPPIVRVYIYIYIYVYVYTHTHIFLVYYTPEPYSARMVKDPVVHGALTISIGYSGIVSHKYQRSPKEQY